jgi:hypothetical protein
MSAESRERLTSRSVRWRGPLRGSRRVGLQLVGEHDAAVGSCVAVIRWQVRAAASPPQSGQQTKSAVISTACSSSPSYSDTRRAIRTRTIRSVKSTDRQAPGRTQAQADHRFPAGSLGVVKDAPLITRFTTSCVKPPASAAKAALVPSRIEQR